MENIKSEKAEVERKKSLANVTILTLVYKNLVNTLFEATQARSLAVGRA